MRGHSDNTPADITDKNIDDRIEKFQDQLKNKYVYKVPLKYLCDIGKINFATKIDLKELFETKKLQTLEHQMHK